MAYSFNVPQGETIDRHAMIAYLNTGTYASPMWGAIGLRVTDSSVEFDWSSEDNKDILGNTFSVMKTPILTQSFDDWPFSGGDEAQELLAQLAIVEQNARALANMDLMIFHRYLTDKGTVAMSFAERYPSSKIEVTSLGGEGGGNLNISITATYGGAREVGTASLSSSGAVTFTPGDVVED